MNFKDRSTIAKFRWGVTPIKFETGRYLHLNVDERVCPTCIAEVESEEHVLTRSHTYINFGNELYNYTDNINVDFSNVNYCDKMCFSLANPDICGKSAKTCYEILCHRRILLYK